MGDSRIAGRQDSFGEVRAMPRMVRVSCRSRGEAAVLTSSSPVNAPDTVRDQIMHHDPKCVTFRSEKGRVICQVERRHGPAEPLWVIRGSLDAKIPSERCEQCREWYVCLAEAEVRRQY